VSNAFSIIIDADIARSSGMSEHPVSSGSRSLLNTVAKNGHVTTMCPILMAEWKKHKSLFARKWLASMIARKKVKFIKPNKQTDSLINAHISDVNKISIAEKDSHLIDAALASDKVIASNDDIARNVFCELSINCGNIRSIKWFNAISDREFVTNHLVSNCFVPKRYYLLNSATV